MKWLKNWTSWLSLATYIFPQAIHQVETNVNKKKQTFKIEKRKFQFFLHIIFLYSRQMLPTHFLKFSRGVMWETSVHRGDETIQVLSSNKIVYILIIYLHYHSAFTSEAPPWLPTKQYPDSTYIPHASYIVWQWHILVYTRLLCQLLEKYTSFAAPVTESPHSMYQYCIWHSQKEQTKALSALSAYRLPYFFPTLFPFQQRNTCHVTIYTRRVLRWQ